MRIDDRGGGNSRSAPDPAHCGGGGSGGPVDLDARDERRQPGGRLPSNALRFTSGADGDIGAVLRVLPALPVDLFAELVEIKLPAGGAMEEALDVVRVVAVGGEEGEGLRGEGGGREGSEGEELAGERQRWIPRTGGSFPWFSARRAGVGQSGRHGLGY